MSAAALQTLRRLTQTAPKGVRALHKSSSPAGGHGHATGGYDDYIHAEHMYNITAMKHRKIKFALGTVGLVGLGVGIPAFAVHWNQKKRMG